MALTSRLTAYDETWPAGFRVERDRIAHAFGGALVAISHIGSTAVPGLVAKPEIDLLVEVSHHHRTIDERLVACGYARGEDLSPGTVSFAAMSTACGRTRPMSACPDTRRSG